MSKEIIFHCGRYPSLGLTVVPFNSKDDKGNKQKAIHLFFKPDPELGAGILRLSNEDMISFVRNHEYSKSGRIIEVDDVKSLIKLNISPKVKAGVHNTVDVRTPSGAPVQADRPVKAAKVPSKKKK
jgi:hypothetical protein